MDLDQLAQRKRKIIDIIIASLEIILNRWIELAGFKYDFNYLRDQLYQCLNSSLVMFLNENAPNSTKQVVEFANRYTAAHPFQFIAKENINYVRKKVINLYSRETCITP